MIRIELDTDEKIHAELARLLNPALHEHEKDPVASAVRYRARHAELFDAGVIKFIAAALVLHGHSQLACVLLGLPLPRTVIPVTGKEEQPHRR